MSAREPTTAERKAGEAVQKYRERFPEIAELGRDILRPVRENPGLLIAQQSGGNRALRRAADKRKK